MPMTHTHFCSKCGNLRTCTLPRRLGDPGPLCPARTEKLEDSWICFLCAGKLSPPELALLNRRVSL